MKNNIICVCSDAKVTRKTSEDDEDESVVDLATPATTNVKSILRQIKAAKRLNVRTVIMSTCQSIDVVSEALLKEKLTVDLVICDEAHRTTGVKISGRDESNFTKVHSNDIIPAKKRLYMTATPRLYRESVKMKAKENDDILCSMDDENIYGKEFHRLSFNDAVSQGLLTDYKVLVLTVNEQELPTRLLDKIKAQHGKTDEALRTTALTRLTKGLSKVSRNERESDVLSKLPRRRNRSRNIVSKPNRKNFRG